MRYPQRRFYQIMQMVLTNLEPVYEVRHEYLPHFRISYGIGRVELHGCVAEVFLVDLARQFLEVDLIERDDDCRIRRTAERNSGIRKR